MKISLEILRDSHNSYPTASLEFHLDRVLGDKEVVKIMTDEPDSRELCVSKRQFVRILRVLDEEETDGE
jgi:hypothetical protein